MKHARCLVPILLVCSAAVAGLRGQDGSAPWSPAQQKGVDFLRQHQQDGVFAVKQDERSFPDPDFTGLALAALQTKPAALRSKDEAETIDAGMRWLLKGQNEDGSFGQRVQNYTTCAVVTALARWPDASRDAALAKAQKYLLAIQHSERTGSSPSDVEYGGVGYGSKGERGDLSNLQFTIAALRDTGLATDHEAFQRALTFLQRTQNLPAVNDLSGKLQTKGDGDKPVPVKSGDDGGAVYYPGESPAGFHELPDGSRSPRSYGSMTYALLKTYTLCGIRGDDPRVQAAVKWIGANWTVVENPGADKKLGDAARFQGLYYYYLLLAQALEAAKLDTVSTMRDGKPVAVDWRAQLKQQLVALQRPDGGWVNDKNNRWYENLDVLCTCYSLLALSACR